jgi:hypothetical protein
MHVVLLAVTLVTCQQWINEIDKFATGPYTHQGTWINLVFRHPIKGGYIGVGEEIYRKKFKKSDFIKAHPEVKTIKITNWSPV